MSIFNDTCYATRVARYSIWLLRCSGTFYACLVVRVGLVTHTLSEDTHNLGDFSQLSNNTLTRRIPYSNMAPPMQPTTFLPNQPQHSKLHPQRERMLNVYTNGKKFQTKPQTHLRNQYNIKVTLQNRYCTQTWVSSIETTNTPHSWTRPFMEVPRRYARPKVFLI